MNLKCECVLFTLYINIKGEDDGLQQISLLFLRYISLAQVDFLVVMFGHGVSSKETTVHGMVVYFSCTNYL